MIDNLTTTTRWVDKFVVECYADAALTQLVGTRYSDTTWNGAYNVQKDAIVFNGLLQGQTYWLRGGVMVPITHRTTYHTVWSQIAGAVGIPSASYEIQSFQAPTGITVRATPVGPAANHDYYEATWLPQGSLGPGTTAKASTGPLYKNQQGYVDFFIGGSAGLRYDAYLRVVDTGRNKTGWLFIGAFSVGTLDDVGDGTDYGRVRVGVLNDGNVDPRRAGLIKQGSLNPSWLQSGFLQFETGPQDSTFAYVKLYWTGLVILRPDGSATSVADLPYPGLTVFNLFYNTTLGFLPRNNEFGVASPMTGTTLDFVADPSAIGLPYRIAFAPGTINRFMLRNQNMQDYMGLSDGAVLITTVASSTSGTSGGGGGGNDTCPRIGMRVRCRERGVVRVETLIVGEHVWTPQGWKRVTGMAFQECNEFIQIEGWDGEVVEVDPYTDLMVNIDEPKKAHDLCLSDALTRDQRINPRIQNLRPLRKTKDNDDGTWVRVKLTIEEPHWFFCGKYQPTISIHNITPISQC